MDRDEVLKILITHQKALKTLRVSSLDLFGSVARGEPRPESDVDCLVEFREKGGLFQLLRVQHYLEDILGCPVDLGTQAALREHLRVSVLKEAIHVF